MRTVGKFLLAVVAVVGLNVVPAALAQEATIPLASLSAGGKQLAKRLHAKPIWVLRGAGRNEYVHTVEFKKSGTVLEVHFSYGSYNEALKVTDVKITGNSVAFSVYEIQKHRTVRYSFTLQTDGNFKGWNTGPGYREPATLTAG